MGKVSFATFFQLWVDIRGWEVPDFHWRIVNWLPTVASLAVLRCFRGGAKSTILEVYNAWRYYGDPAYRILHQSESDGTARKTSRGTLNVLRKHPLTAGMYKEGGVESWWVHGNDDPRNANMHARGIMSNVTSARCDEVQNDDTEVPRNIRTPEAREQLEYRLGEQTFILVPGGRHLYVGTPHTHDSIYDKMEALGADCLTIPLFTQEQRIDCATQASYRLAFKPEYVFAGIGRGSCLLAEGADYEMQGLDLVFRQPPSVLIDCYSGCAWPERFTRDDLQKRRRKTKTINYWDSQYQLHSRPVHEVRLNPDAIPLYEAEPRFERRNRELVCLLGNVQIVGASLRWDPSGGKLRSDTSAVSLVLQDERGCRYWHRTMALTGEVATYDKRGTINGGQVWQLCDLVEKFRVRTIRVETNGIGGFAPTNLRGALKARNIGGVGVKEEQQMTQKNARILEAFEPLMQSRMLWAHVSVADSQAFPQMKEWNPVVVNQPDDYLDVTAGAIVDQPERLSESLRNRNPAAAEDWRPSAGVFDVELDFG